LLNGMVWAAAGALALFVACLEPVRRRWLVISGGLMLTFAASDYRRSGPCPPDAAWPSGTRAG
jgi:hypothetical protein